MKLIKKFSLLRIILLFFLIYTITMALLSFAARIPGKSYTGPLPPQTSKEAALNRELQQEVEMLAAKTGERNYIFYKNLKAAAEYLEHALLQAGLSVQLQRYPIKDKAYYNIEAEKKGARRPEKIIIIGAHYDSPLGSPGANDNGSGVAALLALARAFATKTLSCTVRFVAFVNEEPPWFWTKEMGSYVYAARCKDRGENIIAMLSLETIGCYADEDGSQQYLFPLGFFYPSQGNFIAFVSNLSSRKLLSRAVESFRRHTQFPSEGASLPWFIPGVFWSDHWPFWKMGYPALMITDTAPFRYPQYHTPEDTPDKISYDRLARVVAGLEGVIEEIAEGN